MAKGTAAGLGLLLYLGKHPRAVNGVETAVAIRLGQEYAEFQLKRSGPVRKVRIIAALRGSSGEVSPKEIPPEKLPFSR